MTSSPMPSSPMPSSPMTSISDCRRMPLSKGYSALVDAEDFDRLNRYSWFVWIPASNKRLIYAVRKVRAGKKYGKVLMHREVVNAPRGIKVDHKNNSHPENGLDNRKENLRVASDAQNQWNARKHIDATTSRFKGVVRCKDGYWQAQLQVNRVRKYLGRFKTELAAAKAYNEAAIKLFGDFARINIL